MLAAGQTLKYPVNETQVKTVQIAAGLNQHTVESIVMGKLPRMIVIGFVESEALNGSLAKSPFHFTHFDVSEIGVSWNGDTMENRIVPVSFSTATTSDDYLVALQNFEKTAASLPNGINRDNFKGKRNKLVKFQWKNEKTCEISVEKLDIFMKKGDIFIKRYKFISFIDNCLICVELLPSSNQGLCVNRKGQIRLTLKFRSNLPENTSAVVYCSYQSIIEIDSHSSVIFER